MIPNDHLKEAPLTDANYKIDSQLINGNIGAKQLDKGAIANCPKCKSFRSIVLNKNIVKCINCDFKMKVLCMHCGVGELNHDGKQMVCSHCKAIQNDDQLSYVIKEPAKSKY